MGAAVQVSKATRRFAAFQDALALPTNVLTSRLEELVGQGVLVKSPTPGSSRHQYLTIAKGGELFPVMTAILGWGNRWNTDEHLPEQLMCHRGCGGRSTWTGAPAVGTEFPWRTSRSTASPSWA